MRRCIIPTVLLCVLLTGGWAVAGNVFTDTFDRPDNTDIDASTVGMSGSVIPPYVEVFEGSGAATSIRILNNQLRVAVGNGMSNLYLDHNFLESQKFTISLDVIEINSATSDIIRRFAGFGLGMTLEEANNLGDVNTGTMTMAHPDADTEGVADFFLGLSLDGILRVSNNGTILATYDTSQVAGTIKAEFNITGFNAGDTVAYTIYFDGEEVPTLNGSFVWDNTETSYIGISCRASSYTVVDNLTIFSTDSIASFPSPKDKATDLPYNDLLMTWEPADDTVQGHDVYFGKVFEDVNNANRSNPLGVLLSQGQAANSYDPGQLDFGQTYYWRVDEVQDAAETTVIKGDVWSFVVEPFTYAVDGIMATTNLVSIEGQGPENAVNGSGLDPNDLHSTDTAQMWSAQSAPENPSFIEFDLGRVRKLHEMLVWNHNSAFEPFLGIGLKDVTIEYSLDAVDWSVLGDFELARAPGSAGYAANSLIPFDGVAAQFIRLTINDTWMSGAPQVGLSEVRIMEIPAYARHPRPADNATDVSVDSMLQWRSGRDAVSHDVYIGTDANAVMDETAMAGSASDNEFTPADLLLDAMYYWKVNETDTVMTWEGDLWSFSTERYVVVEDFEAFTDDIEAGQTIWQTWIDGIDAPAMGGGSTVGYGQSPFAEQAVVHGGVQAMPLFFNNTGNSHSETTRTFATAQNWAGNGIQSLVLHIYGDATNVTGQLYLKINGTKVYHNGVSDVLTRAQWMQWPIDLAAVGTDLTNVTTLSVGIDGAGASGVLYVDDILLTKTTTEMIAPAAPSDSDANLAAYYAFEGNANDSTGVYNGTVGGSPEYVAGLTGQAISLNGVNDTVINVLPQETMWPACSVAFWVKTEMLAQANFASMFNNNSSSLDFQLDVDGTDPGNYRYHGTVDVNFGATTTEWTHIATSCDGAQTKLYYNGLYVATANVADVNFGQIAFGVNRAGDVWFNGLIDEARLYDRPLSAGEVAGLAGITESVFEAF